LIIISHEQANTQGLQQSIKRFIGNYRNLLGCAGKTQDIFQRKV
jgi:hypothetical protein